MAIAIDSSTPAIASSTASISSLASSSFSPPSSSLVIVLFAGGTIGVVTPTITDSLVSHLTYTSLSGQSSATAGRAWIWTAPVTSAPGSMTVTVSWSSGATIDNMVSVIVVTGAAASQTGAGHTTATSASGAPSASFTTAGANSLIVGTIFNNTNATGPTIPGGQSDVANSNTLLFTDSTNGSSAWAQYQTGMNLASGATATINDTAPTIEYMMATGEILASSGAPQLQFVPNRMPLGA